MKKWYVVHTYSGKEVDVKNFLQEKIRKNNYNKSFGEILVPIENISEIKLGKKKTIKRKMFPGYILIEVFMTDYLSYFIKNIPYVLGFVSEDSGSPLPMNDNEVEIVLGKIKENTYRSIPRIIFKPGEIIRVVEGPFSDFNGTVEDVNYDKNRLCVCVLIFGRSTPVDLKFSQVEKI